MPERKKRIKRRLARRKPRPSNADMFNNLFFRMMSRGYGMGYNGAPIANLNSQANINSQIQSLRDEVQRNMKDIKEQSQAKADSNQLVVSQQPRDDVKRLEDQMSRLMTEGGKIKERVDLAIGSGRIKGVSTGRPKGSRNKPKEPIVELQQDEGTSASFQQEVTPGAKRTRQRRKAPAE